MMKNLSENQRHILFISGSHVWSMGAGKGASSFYQTIFHYAEAGWEVDLVIGNSADGGEIQGVRIHKWSPKLLFSLYGRRYIGTVARMIYLIAFTFLAVIKGWLIHRHKKISIIYAYEIHGVPAGWLLKKLIGGSLVTRFQGTILYPVMNTPFWRLRYWDHFLALRSPADLSIMANDGTLGDVVLQKIRPAANFRFWINGVNIGALDDRDVGPCDSDRDFGSSIPSHRILTVSRLVNWKRVDRVINAMPEVIRRLPNVELLILGEGPEMTGLRKLVAERNLENHVQFLGARKQSEVASYMAQADIFVSMFDLSNVGNPLLEAMTIGAAVVALNTGGTSSIIVNGKNGVLIEPESIDTLPIVLTELLVDRDRRKELGRSASEYARKNFGDWRQRMATEISEIEKLIG